MNKFEIKFQNTSEKMYKALIDLLKEKRVEEISVTELCIVADVNRSTFYAHFETIGDLLNCTKDYIINICRNDLKSQVDVTKILKEGETLTKDMIREVYLLPFLNTIKKHRDIFIIKEFSQLAELFVDNEAKLLNYFFRPGLEIFEDAKTLEYMSVFFFSGVDSVTQKWLNSGCADSVDEICEIIGRCISFRFD